MKQGFIIAIDGPAGAGKSTISTLLAGKLNGYHLYTGAMYRVVTLYCLENNIDVANENAVIANLSKIDIDFIDDEICLNGKNVAQRIRELDVDQNVSTISDYKEVREAMKRQQRRIAEQKIQLGNIVLADGRDMATVVFPDAEIKIYLTASAEVRAKRRLKQLEESGHQASFDEVLNETRDRDERDMHGNLRYLVENPKDYGYTVIDDSGQTQEQTVSDIMRLLEQKNLL